MEAVRAWADPFGVQRPGQASPQRLERADVPVASHVGHADGYGGTLSTPPPTWQMHPLVFQADAPTPQVASPFANVSLAPDPAQVRKESIRRAPDPDQEFIIAGPRNDLDPHLRKHGMGLGMLSALVLAAGIMITPSLGHSAEGQALPQASVSASAPASGNLSELKKLGDSLGLQAETLQKVAGKAGVVDSLSVMPGDLREMYRTLDQKYKKEMVEKLQGTTGFLFIQVSNREAFVNGKAAGVDAFDRMQETLKEAVSDGKVATKDAGKLGGLIEGFRSMTSVQRAALVTVMEADILGR